MSEKSLEAVLTRAMGDEAFATSLFTNLEQALAGYELTPEELGKLKAMGRAEFDKYAHASPEERKSMWGSWASSGI